MPDLLLEAVPLAPFTTYKLGGPARWLAEVDSTAELDAAASFAAEHAVPLFVLGRGSNVLVSDAGFDGLVVRLVGELARAGRDGSTIIAGGGLSLPRLARYAAAESRGGLEFYVGIPGSVGGAVRMNAGGHGSDTAAVLVDADVFDWGARSLRTVMVTDLGLGYRRSALGPGEIVTAARFATTARPRRDVEEELRAITRWRREYQPGGTLNAGSVFKNPEGGAAGKIIDELGLKGYRRGAVSVSTLHANFFVAEPGASAQQLYELIWDVRRRVGETTGVWLEPEVRFVGRFDPVADAEAGPS